MRFFKPKLEAKANPTGAAVFVEVKGKTRERNLENYIKEGYVQNVIIYRCIKEITTALGSVGIEVHKDGTPVENHPALMLIGKPNPTESWPQFIRHAFADYMISGNMFITADNDGNKPNELWVQPPTKMHVEAGVEGMPAAFCYKSAGREIRFPVDQITGRSQCFHLKTYNPENQFLGMSPLRHIALATDTHNAGLIWNSALLENGARPSGIVKFKGTPSNEVISGLRDFFKKALQGAKNAGEVPMLTEDADWQELGINPKDMDFAVTMSTCAKYIASALGVPLPLVDNDAASYNNIEQAKERFWTDTVLPMLDEFLESFGNWLLSRYGEGLNLAYDADSIPALEGLRAKRFTRMQAAAGAPILSVAEAREAIGYEPDAEGLLVPAGMYPAGMEAEPTTPENPDVAAAKMLKALGYSETEIKQFSEAIYG